MMNKRWTIPLVAFTLFGCGGADNNETTTVDESNAVVEETITKVHQNMTIDVTPNDEFDGEIIVYLGRWYACSDSHPEYCDSNGLNKMTRDDSQYAITIKASDIKAELGESINSDVFADGQFSILDVMLYVSKTRDDFELTLGEFDESFASYPFTVSFDYNQDGEFNEADGDDNFQSPDWYPRFTYGGGEFKREMGDPSLEAIYERAEEFIVRDNTELRIEAFSPEMTKRRQALQAIAVDRVNANGGQAIAPEIQVDFGDGRGYVTVAKDINIKAYNLRPDLFKPGVITIADVLMSAYYDQNLDVEFTYWPTVETGANVDAFAVTSINGLRAKGLEGWVLYSGELEATGDFFRTNATVEQVLANRDTYCPWIEDMTDAQAQVCIDEWNYTFGGNLLHLMADSWLMTYPNEVIRFKWFDVMWNQWESTDQHKADDGQYNVYDITEAVAPLTNAHFGWEIADCSLCHSIDNIHLNGDSPTLPSTAEPYFCASCHGSNGAPKGHGEESRCHWCHSEDKLMLNHGNVSKIQLAEDVVCDESLGLLPGPCANLVTGKLSPIHDKAANSSTYDSDLKVRANSDWQTDEQFPDPYSCVTCHPAE